MKRSHRRIHVIAWLLLLPMLVAFVYYAEISGVGDTPSNAELVQPSGAGVLP